LQESSVKQPTEPLPSIPMTAGKALKFHLNDMSDYEKGEVLDYKEIYFLGKTDKKIKGSPLNSLNYGYDDE
jgi:hypothetical protein